MLKVLKEYYGKSLIFLLLCFVRQAIETDSGNQAIPEGSELDKLRKKFEALADNGKVWKRYSIIKHVMALLHQITFVIKFFYFILFY